MLINKNVVLAEDLAEVIIVSIVREDFENTVNLAGIVGDIIPDGEIVIASV